MARTKSQNLYICIFLIALMHLISLSSQFKLNSLYRLSNQEQVKTKPISIKIKKIAPPTIAKQMVNTIKSESSKKVKTKFMSQDDNFFERETKSKKTAAFNTGSKGHEKAKHKFTKSQLLKSFQKKIKKTGFSTETFKKAMAKPMKVSQQFQMKQGTRFGKNSEFGIAADNSLIEKIQLSDFNRVNTQKSKFFGYFAGIRKSIEKYWGQSLKEKILLMHYKRSRIPASEQFQTHLLVTLNKLGEIIELKIASPSGQVDLDDAAVQAFNQAGPFPNPPKDLVKNGKVNTSWGFVVN